MTTNSDNRPPRILVCNGKNCDADGSGTRIYNHLQAILDEADYFNPPFLLRTANCFDMCDIGPNMVIYPGNRRFNHLTLERVDEILNEHILNADQSAAE